jgi:hypothetical protein
MQCFTNPPNQPIHLVRAYGPGGRLVVRRERDVLKCPECGALSDPALVGSACRSCRRALREEAAMA